MKKSTILLAIVSFVAFTATAQIQRNTLLEVFTSSTCGPCAPGNAQMASVLPSISNYTIVKYQQNFPGSGDPYQTTQAVNRRSFYGINSIPRMEIDGMWDKNAQSFNAADFNLINSVPTNVEIQLSKAFYNPADSTVSVDVLLMPDADNANNYLRVLCAVIENNTTGNVGSNGETIFHQVFMKFIPSESGELLSGGFTNG